MDKGGAKHLCPVLYRAALKIGVSIVSAWTMQPTASHSGHANIYGVQPSVSCIREMLISQFVLSTRSSTMTANLAKNAASGMSAAPVVIHIQQVKMQG